ncbi:transposase [Cohnella thailandensis]|uniref:Transposase n=1 Tax=Cohnella thailandensis TaxID=557557 RepID=A0A841SWL4_9BACL|nr:transposase [Cohnella thailandensis]MBB6636314.1 transposase [Cohnella thailandensis]MBP1973717.1 transposase-like protein [Cohnella thailandensis]
MDAYDVFLLEFGGEEACLNYFYQCRWPEGYRCPSCGHHECYVINSRRLPLYECTRCRYQASVTSGTAMEGTRTPLSKWLFTLKLLSDPQARVNAVQLSKLLHITYKTAYSMLDKIRQSLSLATPDKLSGEAQAGLAIFGSFYKTIFSLPENLHPIAVGASIDEAGNPIRLAMMAIPRDHMHGSIITPMGIDSVKDRFFESESLSRPNPTVYRSLLLTKRHCKTLSSLVKSCFKQLHDTYHGIRSRSLSKYLAEITFRWNAAAGTSDAMQRLSQTCIAYSRNLQAA